MVRKMVLTVAIVGFTVALSSAALAGGWGDLAQTFLSQPEIMQTGSKAAASVVMATADRAAREIRGRDSVKVSSLTVNNQTTTGTNMAILGTVKAGDVYLRNVQAGNVTIDNTTNTGTNMAILGSVNVGNVSLENLDSGGNVAISNRTNTGTNMAILGTVSVGNVTTE